MSEKAITSTSQSQNPPVENTEATTLVEEKDPPETVLKEEHDKVQDSLKQALKLQSQADRRSKGLERDLKKLLKKSDTSAQGIEVIETEEDGEEITPKVVDNSDEQERDLARRRIMTLAFTTPEYLKVIQEDITLSEMLAKEPLFVLSEEWIDAQCAVEDAKEFFDKRVSMLKPEQKKEEEKPKTEEVIPEVDPNLPSEVAPVAPKKKDEKDMTMDEKLLSDIVGTGKKGV